MTSYSPLAVHSAKDLLPYPKNSPSNPSTWKEHMTHLSTKSSHVEAILKGYPIKRHRRKLIVYVPLECLWDHLHVHRTTWIFMASLECSSPGSSYRLNVCGIACMFIVPLACSSYRLHIHRTICMFIVPLECVVSVLLKCYCYHLNVNKMLLMIEVPLEYLF